MTLFIHAKIINVVKYPRNILRNKLINMSEIYKLIKSSYLHRIPV